MSNPIFNDYINDYIETIINQVNLGMEKVPGHEVLRLEE